MAVNVFEIKQAAERAKQAFLLIPGLSADQQGERLKAIEAETRTALRQAMGSNTFTGYAQLYGGWIQVLGQK